MSGPAAYALAVAVPLLLLRRGFGLRFIGLTGGISSGKSSVTRYLSGPAHRLPVIDFDAIAREVVVPGHRSGALQAVRKAFGDGVLREDGTLDRAKLGAIIFNDPTARARLSATMRPAIWSTFARQALHLFFREGHREVVLDVPLLYESGLSWLCSDCVVVYVSEETQRARLMQRDAIDAAVADSKIRAQWSLDRKKALADVVIDNDGTIDELHQKLDAWLAAHNEKLNRHWWRAWVPTVPTVLIAAAVVPATLALTAAARWMAAKSAL